MIDNLLEQLDAGRELDESTVDTLVEALQPGEDDQWTDLETVLQVAEHPALADDLRRHELPPRLEAALAEALDAVLPMLGIKPYGPTYKLADIARRELRRERRKRDAVADKIASMRESDGSDAEHRNKAEKIMGRYLDSDPAPVFVNEMRRLYPDLLDAAKGGFDEIGAFRAALEADDSLAKAMADPTASSPESIRKQLHTLDEELGVDGQQIGAAYDAGDPAVTRLAAGITLVREDKQLIPVAAHAVARGPVAAPTLAVVSGLVAPRVARTVFSQIVAEATLQSPDDPDAELTESRIRAILSARLVLPHVGSPMDPLERTELPDTVPAAMQQLPDHIESLWQLWHDVANA